MTAESKPSTASSLSLAVSVKLSPFCPSALEKLLHAPSALHEADDSPMDDLIKKADNLINAARASRKPGTVYSAPTEEFPDINAAKSTFHKRAPNSQARNYNPDYHTHKLQTHGLCYYHFKNDAHRSPLTRPYRGPYAVLGCNPKAFRLSIAGGSDWVSIDRLKSAYIEEEDVTLTAPPADDPAPNAVRPNASAPTSPPEGGSRCISSRAGRLIRRPNRLNL
ncbi:hypothetical protein Pcinc_034720 [Petrolisthes cinctipes]|uniref:Uncharacterized protein n=1 Tax=Petrolisthes cinctipes TaxID=88211 RepID=A0AAE1BY25_PETCI|nr:hypothetical protein Pcinc_034720 [Petrolisthes cinctipes]